MNHERPALLPPLALLAAGWLAHAPAAQSLSTREVASGMNRALWAGAPAGDDRIFVGTKRGLILVYEGGGLVGTFLDVRPLVGVGSEQGLLGVAFHPDYASNGRFYLDYTRVADGATVVSSWQVSADPNVADPASETVLLVRNQPFDNHNGGAICFGPNDGYLYVAFGDGGSQNDPQCRAQNLGNWLGSILRLDVDGGTPYAIPPDNPFVSTPGAAPEIFHFGLRNPWRMSFDRLTGDLWIGDVGQDLREEISFAGASEQGLNFGWKIMEGTRCNLSNACAPTVPACGASELVAPVWELFHGGRTGGPNAIIGGYVYRGCAIPWLQGTYFFSDHNDDVIRSLVYDPGTGIVSEFTDRTAELDPPGPDVIERVASFGEDGFGELLIVTDKGNGGSQVFKVIDATAVAATNALRNGSGANLTCFTPISQPIIGNVWRGEVDTTGHPGLVGYGVVGYAGASSGTFVRGGELLVDLTSQRFFWFSRPSTGAIETVRAEIPCDPSLNGATAATQAVLLGGARALCNAIDVTLGAF